MSDDLNLDELERDVNECEFIALTMSKGIVLKLIALARNAESWRQASFRYSDRAEHYERALRGIDSLLRGTMPLTAQIKQIIREALAK